MSDIYNASDLFVKALENEGVEVIFGVPGEENLDLLESVRKSKIKLILNRHEQAAGFMAATYGRFTGKVGVVLTTLGPGATNLFTVAAYAKLGGFPVCFVTGQKPIRKSKQGHFQIVDIVAMMNPVTKYAKQIVDENMVCSTIRESFRIALEEKQGPVHIEFPEDISALAVSENTIGVFNIAKESRSSPELGDIKAVAHLINSAKLPLVLIGSACNRYDIPKKMNDFINKTGLMCVSTQMGKGIIADSHPKFIGTCTLSGGDYVHEIIKKADIIINIGYDVAEKPPYFADFHKVKVVHINKFSAQVDNIYNPQHEIVADIENSLELLEKEVTGKWDYSDAIKIKEFLAKQRVEFDNDNSFPMKPQRIVTEINKAMGEEGIVALDNGMYKLWFSRNYHAPKSNSLLLDNALATMGAGLPSAMEIARLYPNKKVLGVAGDGGFMMNSQELELAVRLKLKLTVLILNDNGYGMIKWKQVDAGFDNYGLDFKNPDFVAYANSYGAKGHRVEKAEDFLPLLNKCLNSADVDLIEVAIDYSENKRVLTDGLANKVKVI